MCTSRPIPTASWRSPTRRCATASWTRPWPRSPRARPENESERMTGRRFDRVMVTGGAGYVGARLVPALLEAGYGVTVLDLFLYGDDVVDAVRSHPRLALVK